MQGDGGAGFEAKTANIHFLHRHVLSLRIVLAAFLRAGVEHVDNRRVVWHLLDVMHNVFLPCPAVVSHDDRRGVGLDVYKRQPHNRRWGYRPPFQKTDSQTCCRNEQTGVLLLRLLENLRRRAAFHDAPLMHDDYAAVSYTHLDSSTEPASPLCKSAM